VTRLFAAAAVLAALGCGPKVNMEPSPFEEDDPAAGAPAAPAEPTWEELPVAPTGPGAREGTIDRAALDAVLAAGPVAVISHVEVAAEHDGEKFLGWRLVAVDPRYRGFDGVDLVPGDVLIAVNGRALAHPDHLHALWDALGSADEIVADLRRGEAKLQLRWRVTTAATATAP